MCLNICSCCPVIYVQVHCGCAWFWTLRAQAPSGSTGGNSWPPGRSAPCARWRTGTATWVRTLPSTMARSDSTAAVPAVPTVSARFSTTRWRPAPSAGTTSTCRASWNSPPGPCPHRRPCHHQRGSSSTAITYPFGTVSGCCIVTIPFFVARDFLFESACWSELAHLVLCFVCCLFSVVTCHRTLNQLFCMHKSNTAKSAEIICIASWDIAKKRIGDLKKQHL